jgi:hypothetical protein
MVIFEFLLCLCGVKRGLIVFAQKSMGLFFATILIFSAGLLQSCEKKSSEEIAVIDKKKLSHKELISEVKNLYFQDQKFRRIAGNLEKGCRSDSLVATNPLLNKKTRLAVDIIHNQMARIDSTNTKYLIELTNKYGFPGMKHLNHDIPVFTVFVHSNEKDHKEIRKLIKKEYKTGRVSKFERDYIFWHLNGRKGMPPPIPHPINYRREIDVYKGALNASN